AYSTWVGKSLYLEDLFVKESFRKRKVGSRLLKKIFEIAKEENCKKVQLQVRNWNKPAIDFYKKYGAIFDSESLNCEFKQ
ncbi:MAG TPA: GNAT family N-acetyltransferase, partial [Candidatus Lokiarchaeia archaeon]